MQEDPKDPRVVQIGAEVKTGHSRIAFQEEILEVKVGQEDQDEVSEALDAKVTLQEAIGHQVEDHLGQVDGDLEEVGRLHLTPCAPAPTATEDKSLFEFSI